MRVTGSMKLVSATIIATAATTAFAQQQTVSQRLLELEQRVANIEKRLDMAVGHQAKPRSMMPLPVAGRLFNKKLHRPESAGQQDQFGFLIEFKNLSSKDINTFNGDIAITNERGEELVVFSAQISKYISARDSVTWYGGIPFDPNDPKHQVLLKSNAQSLGILLKPEVINFTDGSTWAKN